MALTPVQQAKADVHADEELVARARARDEAAVRAITTRYNRRLFRVARSILRDDAEAEDVVAGNLCACVHRPRHVSRRCRFRHLDHAHRDERSPWPVAQAAAHGRLGDLRRNSPPGADYRLPCLGGAATIRRKRWRKAKSVPFLKRRSTNFQIHSEPSSLRALSRP